MQWNENTLSEVYVVLLCREPLIHYKSVMCHKHNTDVWLICTIYDLHCSPLFHCSAVLYNTDFYMLRSVYIILNTNKPKFKIPRNITSSLNPGLQNFFWYDCGKKTKKSCKCRGISTLEPKLSDKSWFSDERKSLFKSSGRRFNITAAQRAVSERAG